MMLIMLPKSYHAYVIYDAQKYAGKIGLGQAGCICMATVAIYWQTEIHIYAFV